MQQDLQSVIKFREAGIDAASRIAESSIQCLQQLNTLQIDALNAWQHFYLDLARHPFAMASGAKAPPAPEQAAVGSLVDCHRRWVSTVYETQTDINHIVQHFLQDWPKHPVAELV